jgi:probable HAF family extracellular repeat protein
MLNRILLLTTVSVFVFCGVSTGVQAAYYVTDLGSLGGPSHAMAINNSGQVVGFSYVTADTNGEYRAFLYDGGTTTDLLGANSYSAAYGINDSGVIVGSVDGRTAFFRYDHGSVSVRWFGGTYCEAYAINNSDVIVGYAYLPNNTNRYGFIYGPTKTTGVSFTAANIGSYASTNAINDSGLVVGSANDSAGGPHWAFVLDDQYGYDLGTLGGTVADAYAINANNLVVGSSNLAGDAAKHAFVLDWNDPAGTMTDLGALGGTISEACGINAVGHIVGYSKTATGEEHAFFYNGTMADLNSLIAPSSGTLTSANAINDSGWIVADGTNAAGDSHAFLLKPAMPGDANLDGSVNGADLNAVLSNYNLSGEDWFHGDFNGDGIVNGADLNAVLSNYNQAAPSSSAAVPVPEPSAFLLLLAGAACLFACATAWNKQC